MLFKLNANSSLLFQCARSKTPTLSLCSDDGLKQMSIASAVVSKTMAGKRTSF
jgi:hypothetical protein